jgi:hypothetical protein
MDEETLDALFCEVTGPTDTELKYFGADAKSSGSDRKQIIKMRW